MSKHAMVEIYAVIFTYLDAGPSPKNNAANFQSKAYVNNLYSWRKSHPFCLSKVIMAFILW